MRCEKLNSLGDTCRYIEDNENVTDVYLFKCPCAGGLECHLNQSQVRVGVDFSINEKNGFKLTEN